jgi:23S rRNA (cytosine1962-C5)-methyltransferase
MYPVIKLKRDKDKSLLRFHRWVFSGAIMTLPDHLTDGDWVEVNDYQGNYLATGYYQDGNITVKIISFNKIEINEDFWFSSINEAISLRKRLGYFESPLTNCFRLVNGEGDQLPGLIIDWYNGTIVIQSHSSGIKRSVSAISHALTSILGDQLVAIYHKLSFPAKSEEGGGEYIYGAPGSSVILENGLSYGVNWELGQKTGFFLDQRENRLLLRNFTRGVKVLDAFCYAGGFSLNALAGNAGQIDLVDASKIATELALKNLEMNQFSGRFNIINSDVLNYLQNYDDKYDIIILDPPAYAKHISARHKAVQGYKRLNYTAFNKIKKGGILFTFSCSQVVDKLLFENTIISAAIEAGRMARILYRLTQPPDHPVNIFHPESEYLKGLVLEIS